jgi:hypothetical protein
VPSTPKTLVAIAVLIGVVVYLSFGTLSPCGILRENVRKHDGLAAVLPDGLVDAALAAQYGELSPGRCVSILLNGPRTVAVTPAPSPQPRQQAIPAATPNDPVKVAGKETNAAILECRAKRLRGELKTYLQSAQCSNPLILRAFSAAHYKYMDLIGLFTAKRAEVAEKLDRHEMTETQAQAENARIFSEIVDIERRRNAGIR